jgi:hypothetical protein
MRMPCSIFAISGDVHAAFSFDISGDAHAVLNFAISGDAHAAFNFAATLECPIIFFW